MKSLKKYMIVLVAVPGLLFGLAGCDVAKDSYQEEFMECRTHCQSQGYNMNIDQTKLTGHCRCTPNVGNE